MKKAVVVILGLSLAGCVQYVGPAYVAPAPFVYTPPVVYNPAPVVYYRPYYYNRPYYYYYY